MFEGWAPTQVQEHFDADGNRTGSTVTTMEPMWSESDRELAFALDEYDRSRCPCGCGASIEEAEDAERAFRIDKRTCYARRAIEKVRRQEADRAEATNQTDGWNDGLTYYVSDHFPYSDESGGTA